MFLPDDLVREILSWLPSLKSAFRLCCVCKLWRDLITKDRDFGDQLSTHIHNRFPKNDDLFLIFYIPVPKKSDNECVIRTTQSFRRFGRVRFLGGHYFRGMGSCHGILCFKKLTVRVELESFDYHIDLYNPITREHSPISPTEQIGGFKGLGFGYDSISNDYKVVIIKNNYEVEIANLRTNSLRKLDHNNLKSICNDGSHDNFVYVNGCCYWLLSPVDSTSKKVTTFNFQTEKFSVIEFAASNVVDICVLDDSVAMVCVSQWCKDTAKVWVMLEDGKKKFGIIGSHMAYGKNNAYWFHNTKLFEFVFGRPTENSELCRSRKEKDIPIMLLPECLH